MQKNNITIVVAVALTLATAQSIASNDLQITRTGLNDLAVIAQFGGANISVGKQVVPFGNNDTMMTNSASRALAEKSYNSIVASKQFGATNFNVWLGGSKSRGLSASYAGSNWQLGASAMQYTTERTVSTMLDFGTSSANTPSSQFDPLIPWKGVDKPQQEVDKDKPQQEVDKDKPQQEVAKDKPRQEVDKDKPQQEVAKDKPRQEVDKEQLHQKVDAAAVLKMRAARAEYQRLRVEYDRLKTEYDSMNADSQSLGVSLIVAQDIWAATNGVYNNMLIQQKNETNALNSLKQLIAATKDKIKEYQRLHDEYKAKYSQTWFSAYLNAAGMANYRKEQEQKKLATYQAKIVLQRSIVKNIALRLKAIKSQLDKALATKLKIASKQAQLVSKIEKIRIPLRKARWASEKAYMKLNKAIEEVEVSKYKHIEQSVRNNKGTVDTPPRTDHNNENAVDAPPGIDHNNAIKPSNAGINNRLSAIKGEAISYIESTRYTGVSLHGSYSFGSGISVLAKHITLKTKSKSESINSLEVQYLVRDGFVVGIRKESFNGINNNAVTVATKYAVEDGKSIGFEHRASGSDNKSSVNFSLKF
jgi:FtsZ-interacting cell division protein ZipA